MVFVLDKHKRPLMPCTEKRARLLLQRRRAVVHKMFPFTIRLKDRILEQSELQSLRLKLDPGAKITGAAVLREDTEKGVAVFLAEILHKPGIKRKIEARRNIRRSRRSRKLRYREPRFNNRTRPAGWLPPSLGARVLQTINTVNKLLKLLPITGISTEHVKFDTQLLQNPDISEEQYQRGELYRYEIREYLLEKWQRKCAYCHAENVPMEIEHVIPRSRDGTRRISNLTLACRSCNEAKGAMMPQEWLEKLSRSQKALDQRRACNLPAVLKKLREPLRDAAMINATRWALYERLKATGLPVECGTGARTKMQRTEHQLSKTHYYDACCVGAGTPKTLVIACDYVSVWAASGRGIRKMCNLDKYGFPRSHRKRKKSYYGFQTGDLVVAHVPKGKYAGRHVGRVSARESGDFDIKDHTGKRICQGVSCKHMQVLQRGDGWRYGKQKIA
jgi:5-methylcytosine-specific restriction endonuclease McrA